ncbi:MAG: HU family DNA-binding protein [Solobacterium sp.]|nr:HU family DNA-binding protein [Solobacterium sp.]
MQKTILYKNKKDIVNRITNNTKLSKKDAETVVNEVFAEIIETLQDNGEMSINGFGKFEVKTRAARTAINPRTKEKVEVPARRTPAFKPAKALKDKVK